ncbi:MAG TPA: antitoxin Xre/MbcA/ParS toxin-binding domain-containing protein [Terriglobales bacterium]|nr:antitoxin Xre/MbcA/ParS toxin-binding domain-containing protein [Terriglobales bacterium]
MSVLHQQIGQWLGVAIPRTEQQMLEIVEHQLPTSAINRLVSLGLTRSEIDVLVIPLRTLQHRRSRREKLTVEESDRVLRIARLLSQAESLYGSRERALAWLRRPHPRLRNRPPLEMAKTDTGSRIVEELLVQIDEGMVV